MKPNVYAEGMKILLEGITKIRKEDIKTIADIDTYRYQHPVNNSIQSRYGTMKELYGERQADIMMRELEVKAWVLPQK